MARLHRRPSWRNGPTDPSLGLGTDHRSFVSGLRAGPGSIQSTLAVVTVLSAAALAGPERSIAWAADPDIPPLSDEFKTEDEREIADPCGLTFGIGTGGRSETPAQVIGQVRGASPERDQYLDELGLTQSTSIGTARLTGTCLLDMDWGLGASIAGGLAIVGENADDNLPGLQEITVDGLDPRLTLFSKVVDQTRVLPEVTLSLSGTAPLAATTGAGSGLYTGTFTVAAKKHLDDELYGLASTSYTHRFSSGSVEPSGIGAGTIGFGTLVDQGQARFETSLTYLQELGDTMVGDSALPAGNSLLLSFDTTAVLSGARTSLSLGGSPEFSLDNKFFWLEVSFPLWP